MESDIKCSKCEGILKKNAEGKVREKILLDQISTLLLLLEQQEVAGKPSDAEDLKLIQEQLQESYEEMELLYKNNKKLLAENEALKRELMKLQSVSYSMPVVQNEVNQAKISYKSNAYHLGPLMVAGAAEVFVTLESLKSQKKHNKQLIKIKINASGEKIYESISESDDVRCTNRAFVILNEAGKLISASKKECIIPEIVVQEYQRHITRYKDSLRYDDVMLKSQHCMPGYEHLAIQLTNMCHEDRYIGTFDFRISAAAVDPDGRSSNPRLEFPDTEGTRAAIDGWYEESTDWIGSKLELRFEVTSSAMDLNVWGKLTERGQHTLYALIEELPALLDALNWSDVGGVRNKTLWSESAAKMREITDIRLGKA